MVECRECDTEGFIEVEMGYRQFGSGYGDCEQVFERRMCEACRGDGEVTLEEAQELWPDEFVPEEQYFNPEGDVPF